jgi:hypothetical protein
MPVVEHLQFESDKVRNEEALFPYKYTLLQISKTGFFLAPTDTYEILYFSREYTSCFKL